ncbi:hypothetical protein Tco_1329270 [Tanacetum coccineum]
MARRRQKSDKAKGLDEDSAEKEKEELRPSLNVVPREDVAVASITTKQDVQDLYRLVKERFETASPKGYDRLLWGDLITLFEPSEDDDIWKAQQDYTVTKPSYTRNALTYAEQKIRGGSQRSSTSEKLDDLRVNHKFRGGLLGIITSTKFILLDGLSTA